MEPAQQAAALLLQARDSLTDLATLPAPLNPTTEAQAYAIQAATLATIGPIGGWKVGAASPDSPPSCAPLPAAWILPAPATLPGKIFTKRGIESEIAFRLATDLPPRATPYTRAEIIAAIATCHPAIEILQSRLTDPSTAGLANLADLIQHGAFIWGTQIEAWQAIDFTRTHVLQTIEGGQTREAIGNPAGDMLRLITWLANQGAIWAGGLKTGQFITCGSWTGATPAPAGAKVVTKFAGADPVELRFEP